VSRLLIVNADDYGLTTGVSRAILEAHDRGVVTSTSVLALGPAFERTAHWLAGHPTLGAGAHLAAVGEDPPLLGAREIPSLVDGRGRLPHSWRVFLPRMAAGRIDRDDLRREFAAQFERIRAAGIEVDHVDTHQNLHLWPEVRDVVLEVGDTHGVRAVRVTRSTARTVVGSTVRALATRFEAVAEARGWHFPDAATGLDEAGGLDTPRMIDAVFRLAARGARSAELATHPGSPDDPDLARYVWGYRWADEAEALRSAALRRAVDEQGWRLGTFADLVGSRSDAA
jgi:predicted glycoside hydrolase/deacetylase ChbG (UPF0249 family)